MKDYIKEGLSMRISPSGIYKNICKALENQNLTDAEREELEKQKEKAKKYADMLGF